MSCSLESISYVWSQHLAPLVSPYSARKAGGEILHDLLPGARKIHDEPLLQFILTTVRIHLAERCLAV